MLPSSTVENYLKAILQAQNALAPAALVPMGQLAAALGVVPGTATTMVKTLAESGLVRYEPYAGVRLTAAGDLHACLGHDDALSLRNLLRAGASNEEITAAVRAAVSGKRGGHEFQRTGVGAPTKHMISIGG